MFKKIELVANIAVICIAVVVVVVFAKRQFYLEPQVQASGKRPTVDVSKLPLLGIDWSKSEQTLLLSLSRDCHFCTESASFYQRLAKDRSANPNVRLIAVLPQSVDEGQKYLARLGVSVDEVRQNPPQAVVASGTPTLILVGRTGQVLGVWSGKLASDKESEIAHKVRCGTGDNCI
jgi:hypothetical protein